MQETRKKTEQEEEKNARSVFQECLRLKKYLGVLTSTMMRKRKEQKQANVLAACMKTNVLKAIGWKVRRYILAAL